MGSAAAGLSREEAKVLTQVRDKGTGMKKKKEKRKKRGAIVHLSRPP